MDAEKAFVTLTVLTILNKAQAFLPFSINSVIQVRQWGREARQPWGLAGRPNPMHPHTAPRGGGQAGGGAQRREAGRHRGYSNAPACHSLSTPSIIYVDCRLLLSPLTLGREGEEDKWPC